MRRDGSASQDLGEALWTLRLCAFAPPAKPSRKPAAPPVDATWHPPARSRRRLRLAGQVAGFVVLRGVETAVAVVAMVVLVGAGLWAVSHL